MAHESQSLNVRPRHSLRQTVLHEEEAIVVQRAKKNRVYRSPPYGRRCCTLVQGKYRLHYRVS